MVNDSIDIFFFIEYNSFIIDGKIYFIEFGNYVWINSCIDLLIGIFVVVFCIFMDIC